MKIEKLQVFNKIRTMSSYSDKHVSGLITQTLNVTDEPRYVSAKTAGAFSNDIDKFLRNFIDISKPSYNV